MYRLLFYTYFVRVSRFRTTVLFIDLFAGNSCRAPFFDETLYGSVAKTRARRRLTRRVLVHVRNAGESQKCVWISVCALQSYACGVRRIQSRRTNKSRAGCGIRDCLHWNQCRSHESFRFFPNTSYTIITMIIVILIKTIAASDTQITQYQVYIAVEL